MISIYTLREASSDEMRKPGNSFTLQKKTKIIDASSE